MTPFIKAVCAIAFVLVASEVTCAEESASHPPNLVIILVDDLGYADVGFNGCEEFQTPNIDRIAREGIRFTSGYVSYPVCGPSRAGLMTGRYQDRFGFCDNPVIDPTNKKAGLPLSESTIADALRPVGYRTAAVGKWHLGTHPSLHPLNRGFDEFFGFLSGGHDYFPDRLKLNDLSEVDEMWGWYRTKLLRNRTRVETHEYLTDELSDEAVRFVKRSADQPFFLYLAYNAPHGPLQATEEYLQRVDRIADKRRRTYAAMVLAVDDGVGRLLETLEQQQIARNTLVVFLSDNGGPLQANASDNGVLRGKKGTQFEGGLRVPFAARWPAKYPQGVDYDHPVISLDIFATIAAEANAKPTAKLDGVNLTPYVTGANKSPPHSALFWRSFRKQQLAARIGDNKLMLAKEDPEYRLFNVANDVAESSNLAAQQLDTVEKFESAIHSWTKDLKPPAFPGLGTWKRTRVAKEVPKSELLPE